MPHTREVRYDEMRDGFSKLMSMPMHPKDPETVTKAFVLFIAPRRASAMTKGWLGNQAERRVSPAPAHRE